MQKEKSNNYSRAYRERMTCNIKKRKLTKEEIEKLYKEGRIKD